MLSQPHIAQIGFGREQSVRSRQMSRRMRSSADRYGSTLLTGIIILTVSGGYQSQKMGLVPFSPPLRRSL